ncbi:protein of unknown function [Petrocella atlantisensis]|uniref:Uncharacterized protein n=1 Tax=Petrocella atlantisensis TaxID=2173034 RepID=A0A3P7PF67_9FIRM|nr:protein of unknown function [Petrocella atlantisensis]
MGLYRWVTPYIMTTLSPIVNPMPLVLMPHYPLN